MVHQHQADRNTTPVFTFHIAINTLYPGIKLPSGDPRWGRYTGNFKPKLHTLATFAADVRAGYSFSPVMKGNYRSQANFLSAQHLVLDFDNGDQSCSLDALGDDPFIRTHAALLYATPSSTPEAPRSRVFFLLDQQVTDTTLYNKMALGLVRHFPSSDQTVGEAARFLYGMKPGDDYRILGNILSNELALSLAPVIETPPRPSIGTPQRPSIAAGAWTGNDDYRILDLLQQYIPSLQWRTTRNNRSKYTMRCPFCKEYVEEEANAFTVSEDEKFFNCFACGVKGNAWQLFTLLAPQEAAKKRLSRRRIRPEDDPNSDHPNDPPEEQSLRSSRYGLMYAARHQLEKIFEEGQVQNDELSTHTRVGGKLVIFTENPDIALRKTQLDGMLDHLWMDGKLDFKVKTKHLDCGREFRYSCPAHGEQQRYHRKCKYAWCADCGTDTTAKLSNVEMVELEGEKRYREVWFDSEFAVTAKEPHRTRDAIKGQVKRWVQCIQSVCRNKAVKVKGHVLARCYAMYLWADMAVAHWKVMFLEDVPGDCDWAVDEIRRKMQATEVASRTYQSGENAIVQLMDDASRTLLGIEEGPHQRDLFWAFREATKGGHNFQGMATLYKQLREISKPEQPVCQVPCEGGRLCGLPLVSERVEDVLPVAPVDQMGTSDPPPLRQRQLELVW